jgi:hypothetical protein
MHAANPENSRRLLRVLGVLAGEAREFSTLELQQRAQVCAVGTCVSELRHKGHAINCRRAGGVFYYSLAARAGVQLAL